MLKPVTLTSKLEIQKLFQRGRRTTQFPLTIVYRKNNHSFNRYLFCADRSCRKAVSRNKVKRLLRVLSREASEQIGVFFDIALIANVKLIEYTHEQRKKAYQRLLQQMIHDK
ncbi:MAG: ribonuclease P protein component [Spirochaetota bacterium]